MEEAYPKKILITNNMPIITKGAESSCDNGSISLYLEIKNGYECKKEDLKIGIKEVCDRLLQCFEQVRINEKTYPSNILITKDMPRLMSLTEYCLGEDAIKLELELKNVSRYDEYALNTIIAACQQLLGCFGVV